MKKSKVTKVLKMDKKDGYGNTSYIIEFENGDKGYYTSKSDNQNKFVPGQEAEYEIEKKQGKNGNEYFKVKPPASEGQQSFRGGGRPQVAPRIQMISFSMSYAKDLVVAGKIEVKELPMHFDIIYNEMISKL